MIYERENGLLEHPKVYTGPRGAPYIVCRGKKIYLNVSEKAMERNEEMYSRREANRKDD